MSSAPLPPPLVVPAFPPRPAAGFDPSAQNVTFYLRDGQTLLGVPLAAVDGFNDESASMAVSCGAQIGACLVVLAAVLVLTPAAKLRRPMALLHMLGLAVCLARGAFQVSDFVSPVVHFYVYWAGDYSAVAPAYVYKTVAGHVATLLVVVAIEAALMNQAWTMVSLWPGPAKYGLAVASAAITLATVGFRIVFAALLSRADIDGTPREHLFWLMQATLVANTISIFWFCAIFNAKLVLHLVSNRGVLPSAGKLNSMEILIMTNGILMVFPVVFAGLEWGHFRNFEPATLTTTSVAIVLPLGTLAAQRMAASPGSAASNLVGGLPDSRSSAAGTGHFKASSLSTSCGSGPGRAGSPLSRCERGAAGGRGGRVEDAFDLELRQIDSTSALTGSALTGSTLAGIRIDRHLEQRDERL